MRGRAGTLQRLRARSMSFLQARARPADDGTADLGRNRHHRCEIPIGGDGKAGLDEIHSQAVELMRHAHFFLDVHAATRRLFAVAKCGVEYSDLGAFHAEFPPWLTYMLTRLEQEAKLIFI